MHVIVSANLSVNSHHFLKKFPKLLPHKSRNVPKTIWEYWNWTTTRPECKDIEYRQINQIFEEASKDSKFYQHKYHERMDMEIVEMKAANKKVTEDQKEKRWGPR